MDPGVTPSPTHPREQGPPGFAKGAPPTGKVSADVSQQLIQALVQESTPSERTAALIALLHALRCEHKIINPGDYGLSRRQLRSRAEQIADGNWASEAVRTAIREMTAAVAAAANFVAAVSARASSSG